MLRAIIADDHPIFRAGARLTLVDALGPAELHEADDAVTLQTILTAGGADLLLLDIYFPGLEPEADLRRFRREHPLMAILVVSMLADRHLVERLLRAGANGFISKSAPPEKLIAGIRGVMAGDRPLYLQARGPGRPPSSGHGPLQTLAPRQLHILKLICLGLSNKEISNELEISASTVREHVSALLQKLGVANRAAAASLGASLGVLASSADAEDGGT